LVPLRLICRETVVESTTVVDLRGQLSNLREAVLRLNDSLSKPGRFLLLAEQPP
jgi:hypothetical protein